MGKLEEMEWNLLKTEQFAKYEELTLSEYSKDRQHYIDPVRYMMALAYDAERNNLGREIVFMGGLAVLSHLVHKHGPDIIPSWRGSDDLDLLVRNVAFCSYVSNVFDALEVNSDSLTIGNKRVVQGHSSDANNRPLSRCNIDVYYPNKGSDNGIPVNDVTITSADFGKKKRTSAFFGVPVFYLSIPSLLNLKLNVKSDTGLRDQDAVDICNLLAIAEQNKLSLDSLVSAISPVARGRLSRLLNGKNICEGKGYVQHPTKKYREALYESITSN